MTLSPNASLTDSLDNQSTEDSLIAGQLYQHFENQPKSIVVESEQDTLDSFVDLAEETQQEGLNSEIKLNFPLNESFYNTLRADESSDQATHADLLGTSFVINGKKIGHDFILRLCGQYNHLILLRGRRSFAMQIFTEMFKDVEAKIPNDLILKELVTNCNPAGYGGSFHRQLHNTFIDCGLVLRGTEGSINIECNDSNCVSIKYNPSIPVSNFDNMEEKICELNCSLEFTLESQNGKVELIIPKKLTNYSKNVNILIDKIKEHFLDIGKFMAFGNAGSKESSFVIVPENLAFSKIIDVLDKAIKGDYKELDKITKSLQNYENIHVNGLDSENFRNFCSQQLNLEVGANSTHQHIFGNILSRYKFNADSFNYDHSVTELILLEVATNDKLTQRYKDALFNQENFSLLPLIVGGKKYIETFIEEFNDIYLSSLSSTKLTDKVIQLDEFNKIGFFSIIALRQEQNLLDAVLVQYMVRDLAQALEAGEQNPVYGILETSSLVKNEEFIMRVLDAFERDVSNQTKQDLLKNSFIILLAAAISQVHDSIVEHLCTKYTEGKHPAIQAIYTEAFANDKVIEQIKKQVLKEINSSSGARKNKARKIYNLILESASNVGNIACIEKILDLDKVKNDSQLLRESLTTVLNQTENPSVIECLLKKYSENIISGLESDKIKEHFSDKKGEEVILKAPAQSRVTQIQGIVDFAGEAAAALIDVGFEQGKMLAEAGYKAMFDPTKVQEEEEENIVSDSDDEYHEVALPMAFADVKDILDKAKQGDYEKLDAIISSESSGDQLTKMEEQKEESMISSYNDEYYEIIPPMACADVLDATPSNKSSEDQLITDLNDENFKNFCSQYLNLDLQREEHENLLYKYQTEDIYSVKELMLLAIVANEKLTEKYSKDILSNQIFYKKDFIPLLLFICCEDFVKNLSNHVEKLGRNIDLYDRALTVIEAALSAENTDCVKEMINLLRGAVISSPDGQVIMTPLEFSVQFCPLGVTKILLEHGIGSGADKALSLAVQRSNLEVVKLLVAKGAIVTDQIMELVIKINQRCIERNEQSVTEDERKARKEVVQFLTERFVGSQPANSQKNRNLSRSDSGKGSSPDISGDEVTENEGNLTTEGNNGTINTEGPVNGFLSNSNNFKELKMGRTKINNNILASPVRTKIAGLISIGSSNLREELELILKNASPKQVLQYIQDQKGGTYKNEAEDIVKSYIKNNKKNNHSNKAAKGPVRSTKSNDAELFSSSDTEGQSPDSGRSSASASGQSTPVSGGAGSATENWASQSASEVSNNDKQSDASKKSAGSYKLAASLLLGGGVCCGVLALSLYYTCAVSVLTAGIIAGVGVPLFLIAAAAVVHFCKPKTLSEDSNVEKFVTVGQGTSQAVPSSLPL